MVVAAAVCPRVIRRGAVFEASLAHESECCASRLVGSGRLVVQPWWTCKKKWNRPRGRNTESERAESDRAGTIHGTKVYCSKGEKKKKNAKYRNPMELNREKRMGVASKEMGVASKGKE